MAECEMINMCRAKAVEDAKFDGGVSARITNIETCLESVWKKLEDINKTILSMVWKLGLVSGGTALVISLVVSIVTGKK